MVLFFNGRYAIAEWTDTCKKIVASCRVTEARLADTSRRTAALESAATIVMTNWPAQAKDALTGVNKLFRRELPSSGDGSSSADQQQSDLARKSGALSMPAPNGYYVLLPPRCNPVTGPGKNASTEQGTCQPQNITQVS